ncbi:MAG: hypothetical protein ACI8P9_002650 [Parasphingorhabdus sp.]|jgi:hypothetical protein
MPRIVIDNKSIQAIQHMGHMQRCMPRKRLDGFLNSVHKENRSLAMVAELDCNSGLKNADLLLVLTRSERFPFTENELDEIEKFVANGGNLLLMTNHGSVVDRPEFGDYTVQDGRLARRFGVHLVSACFRTLPEDILTYLPVNEDAQWITDPAGLQAIQLLATNTCCGIDPRLSAGKAVVKLPPGMQDTGPQKFASGSYNFCQTVDAGGASGRVMVCADSGILAEPEVEGTGPGLFEEVDNAAFILSSIDWLLANCS